MAKLRYHLCPAEFCLFSLELEQNAHTKWCSSFFIFFLWPLWINFKSYGVFLSQWALLHLTALCFYILNYDIKVIKICQKRGENINKGPCSEFSPSQLPVAFIQLSDPSVVGEVLLPHSFTYLSNLALMSGKACPLSTTESCGLKFASYSFTYSTVRILQLNDFALSLGI